MSSDEALRQEFDRWAQAGKGESMGREHENVTRQALSRTTFGADDVVLDVGCGSGWAVRLMRSFGAGRVVGIDISPEMIERGRRSLSETGTDADQAAIELLVASATDLPFPDDHFTRVLSVESIYYYPELDAALREIRRVCRKEARCLCVVDLYQDNPGAHSWVEELDVDVHLLSAAEYARRFRVAGFAKVATTSIRDSRPIPSEDEYRPSRWFPDYAAYRTYREIGVLLIDATA